MITTQLRVMIASQQASIVHRPPHHPNLYLRLNRGWCFPTATEGISQPLSCADEHGFKCRTTPTDDEPHDDVREYRGEEQIKNLLEVRFHNAVRERKAGRGNLALYTGRLQD